MAPIPGVLYLKLPHYLYGLWIAAPDKIDSLIAVVRGLFV